MPGDNSTHNNFQATTATSRLQQQLPGYNSNFQATTATSRLQQQLPGYNSNFQATTATSRLQQQLWTATAGMHVCACTHTHSSALQIHKNKTGYNSNFQATTHPPTQHTSRLQHATSRHNNNFQATTATLQATTTTSRLQKQYGLHACMHVCACTHTHSVLYKYTKTKPFIHHLPLSHIHTHPHTHSQLYKCTDTKSFIPSLPHTHLQLHTEMLFFSHTYIYTLRCPPPHHTHRLSLSQCTAPPICHHTHKQILSLSMYTLTQTASTTACQLISHTVSSQPWPRIHFVSTSGLLSVATTSSSTETVHMQVSCGLLSLFKTSMFTCRSPVGCFLPSKHQCSHAGLLWVAFSLQNINVHMQVSCGLLSLFKTSMFTCRSPVGCFLPSKHQCSHAGLLWVAFSLQNINVHMQVSCGLLSPFPCPVTQLHTVEKKSC